MYTDARKLRGMENRNSKELDNWKNRMIKYRKHKISSLQVFRGVVGVVRVVAGSCPLG